MTLTLISQVLFWSMLALIAGQAVLALGFMWTLWRFRRPLPADQNCPRASVVLCLRGADPFLSQCVEAILDQDYPNYDVRVVIDHPDDPAWPVVQEVVTRRGATHVSLIALEQPRATCSLKCSGIVQAVTDLDPAIEFIAQLDADVVPHRTWLRELAGGLEGERVGAATGNRWYMPDHPSAGTLVRYLWNAAAVVQMYLYGIAWGGTLAVKTRLFRETDLLDRWSNAFGEDTLLFSELRRSGYWVRFVPSLLMVNRESCDLSSFSRWVRRQLLAARLYHPGFLAVIGHAALTSVIPALTVGIVVLAALLGNWPAALWAAAGVVVYQVAMIPLLAILEGTVRRIVASRGEPTNWLSWRGWLATFCLIPVTQVVYASAMVSSLLLRRVDWRGVEYQIHGPWGIRLVEYKPYVPHVPQTPSAESHTASL